MTKERKIHTLIEKKEVTDIPEAKTSRPGFDFLNSVNNKRKK